MKYVYKVLFVFWVTLTIAACQTQDIEETVEYSAERGQSVIAFTDAVPVFRKNGVFWKYGATHAPVLSSPIAQKQANFELYEKKGLVVWTPDVGPLARTSYAYFDASIPKGVKVIPFVSVGDTLYLMKQDLSDEICTLPASDPKIENDEINTKAELKKIESLFKEHAKVSPRLFDYVGKKIRCVSVDKIEDGVEMIPLTTSRSPEAIGFFFKGRKGKVIELKNFHLGTNKAANNSDGIEVRVEKTLDGKIPTELHVLTHEGVESVIAPKEKGQFSLPRKLVAQGPFRLWVDENNLAVFPPQGGWLDPVTLIDKVVIKQVAEFPIDETKTNKRSGKRRRIPHRLSVWRGSTATMKVQEYEGITFTNNFGKGDRDRSVNNNNECLRGVILGGSYVDAAQTKVSEKPGIIAEAYVGQSLSRCVEIFTYAQSRGRAENFINDAKNLVNDFDLNFVIFSVSRLELCSQNDEYYNVANGRDITTPKNWRVVDGKAIAPVSQENAIRFKPNPLAARDAVSKCRYENDKLLPIEAAPLEKMKQIESIIEKENEEVEVLFFDFKDVLAKKIDVAERISNHCASFKLKCYTAPKLKTYEFKKSENRYSKYLYRYKNDGHPNVRANQHVARGLTDMLTDVYGPTK